MMAHSELNASRIIIDAPQVGAREEQQKQRSYGVGTKQTLKAPKMLFER
jgi:hypothetical protein